MRENRAVETNHPDGVPLVGGEAFASFYARHHRRLVGLAFAVSGSRIGAEHLAQDALMAAFSDWTRIRQLDHPEAWVRRILLNQASSWYRRRAAELRAITRLASRRDSEPFSYISDDAAHLWNEVRRLPERQMQVVALRYVEDLTLEAIGEVLGCSKETVNTHLRRARRTLGERLDLEVNA